MQRISTLHSCAAGLSLATDAPMLEAMSHSSLNPLRELHEQAGAEFQAYADIEIVSTFNEPQAEYSAIHTGCGLMDLPQRGLIEITGRDRLTFLNNLLSNELVSRETKKSIDAGQCVYAYLLNQKTGRIITDLNVLELGDRTTIEMDARMIDPLLKMLDQYRFGERVQWSSRLGEWHELALHGKTATAILQQSLPAMSATPSRMLGQDIVIWRDDVCGKPGLHLIVPGSIAAAVWNDLLARFGQPDPVQYSKRELRPIGWAAFNAARIEAGRELFGIDFDDSILPLELSLTPRGVSFTKGCYPGQEIVARMHARQQVARQLVGLRMQEDALPVAGTTVYDDAGNAIGGITSSTVSPILSNACLAMGFLKRPHFEIGTTVQVPAEGAMRKATVVQRPFVASP